MSLPILYLVKLSISLSIVWLFYHLLLRKLTFYNLNRWYLLGYSLLSFLIPLIDIDLFLGQDPQTQPVVIKYIPVIGHYALAAGPSGFFDGINFGDVFLMLTGLGSLFLMVRFLIRWQALRKIRRHATLIEDGGMRIYQVDKAITPFSFGSAIYINGHQHSDEEWSAIIRHERVHVRQRHTIDILLAEFICMVNWYNPFTWLIRHAIRQNLEFIADNRVVDSGCDKKSYQYHLLKVAGQSRYCLANNFNFSSLKKRIIMMNKDKSARLQLVKFLFIVPFLAVLLIAFRTVSAPAPATRSQKNRVDAVSQKDVLPQNDALLQKDALPQKNTLAQNDALPQRGRLAQKDTVPQKNTLPITKDTAAIPVMLRLKGPAKPLFIVDGKELPQDFGPNTLNPNDISSISVLKDEAAKALYGAKGANGVILVTTKKAAGDLSEPVKTSPGANTMPPDKIVPGHPAAPVPNAPVPNAPVPGAPAPTITIKAQPSATVPGQPPVFVSSRAGSDTLPPALYIVDGIEKTREEMLNMPPGDIESINVYKDAATLKKYGEKGRNGVVFIKMKKPPTQK